MHSLAIFTVLLLICFQDMIQHAQADGSLSCYGRQWKWYDSKTTWNVARKYCASKRLRLATVHNSNEFIHCLGKVPYPRAVPFRWIGLNDQATEGVYRWDATQHTARTGTWWWAVGEPNNYRNGEDCILFRGSDKRLNDHNCNVERAGFICEVPRPVHGRWTEWSQWSACSLSCGFGFSTRTRSCTHPAPLHGGHRCQGRSKEAGGCSSGACPSLPTPGGSCPAHSWWFPGALKCYIRQDNLLRTWLQAAMHCRQLFAGARMLSINSQEEQDEVSSHVLRSISWGWFNATDTRTEAVWRQGSTPLTYTNWNFMTGEPNGGSRENCASIQAERGGFWVDNACVYPLHVFCERDFLVKYGCGDWSSWSECTVTCGGGTQTKTRQCVFANGTYDDLRPQECSTQQCPGWSAFSAVTPCIVCGAQQGKQLHARKCLLTGVDADNECAESSFDWRDCNEQTTLGCTLMQGMTLAEVPERTCTDIDGDLTYSLTNRKCMDELNTSVSLDVCRREIVQLCSPIHAQALIGECAKPSDLADGAYHYVASDRVEYVCNHGYKMATNETDNNLHVRKCVHGEWIPDTVMSCEPVTCPDVKDILNGDLSVDAAYPEGPLPLHSTVIYSCNDGYEFSDGTKVLTRVCQANGHWSGQQPACEGVSCSEYTAPEHGFLLQPQPKYQHPYTIHIACDRGYARQGLSYSECLSSGLWSDGNTPIQCMATTCAMFQVDLPLKVQINSQVFGSKATFTCDTGYKLVGGAEQTCEPICQSFNFVRDHFICSTASWSGTQPVCDVVKCPAPVDIAHGTVSTLDDSPVAGEQDYQKVIRYTCNSGYHLAPGLLAARKCQANGEWSGQLPRCDGVPCPNPLMSPNAWVSGQSYVYPNTIEMGCKRGYYATGSTRFTCTANQVWSPELRSMRCEPVRCTPFQESGQVVVQYTGEGTAFGAQVTFSCKPGYEVANNVPRTATCTAACGDQGNQGAGVDPQPRCTQSSGVWTASPPECKAVECPEISKPTNGYIRHDGGEETKHHFQIRKQFSCRVGYELASPDSRSRVCQADRMWSGPPAICSIVVCRKQESPRNGWRFAPSATFGSTETIGCDENFFLPGDEGTTLARRCSESGEWKPNLLPMCAPLDCGPPDVTAHLQTTSLTQELGNLVNGQVRHTCPRGFATSRDGDRIRRCESRCNRHTSGNSECRRTSARWTGTPPSCSRIPCAATTAPPSGKIITSELAGEVTNITNGQRAAGVYGTKLTFGCNDGFKMLGAGGNTFECGPASQWLGRKPICVPVCLSVRCPRRSEVCVQDPHDAHKPKCVCQTWDMCPDDYSPVCGTDASEHDNRCLARVEECASNTTIDVAREGFCERAGKCHEEKPRPPPNRNCAETRYRYFYDNSSRTCRSMYVGRCYTAGGDNSFQHLSQCMTTCEGGNACDQSPDPGPCKQMTERFYYDSSENTCKSFQYGGCFGNENNFASKKSCENTCRGVKCPAPASIVNGAVSVADRSVGSTAAFTCDEGYRLRGEAQTQCQQTGNWSNAVPACVAQCPPARCSSEDRLPCSQEGIRPIHACAAGALRNTDIAILARLRRDTEDCSNNQHVTFKMRVRSELYRSAQCSFLPSTDRYDVTMQLRLEDGCPCPLAKYDTWYMITAVCNEQQRLLTLHDQSIFKPRTDKALRNLINRCGYSQR